MDGDYLTGALRETLAVFDTVPPGTPLTTSEIQDELDVGRRSTYERLDRLADAGRIETKPVGSRGRIWWLPPADQSQAELGIAESVRSLEAPHGWEPDVAIGPNALHGDLQRDVEPYQRILETMEDGVYVVDTAGRITLVNDAYCEMTGYSREELVGMNVQELVDDESADRARQYVEELFNGDREFARFEADVETADGSTFRGEGVFSLLERQDGRVERVGVVRDVSERNRRERTLEQSREWLATLNDLNHVFRDITHAVIEQSTRTEIEHVVCEALADTESYGPAWIGDVDGETKTIRPQTVAGADVSHDDGTISIDPDDPNHCESTARAVLDREIQVRARPPTDIENLPGWETIEALGLRASAAIPIGYDSAVYGVLSVYTDRENGFGGQEISLFEFLGEVVGHAITSVERKRALMSDEVIELEFRIEDIFESLGLEAIPGHLKLENIIPLGENQFLAYGTASAELQRPIGDVVDVLPYCESITTLEDSGSEIRFEARVVDPPVISAVSNQGGYIDVARLDDGDLYMRIHIAAGSDSRQIVNLVHETYPAAQLVSQRQIIRSQDSPIRLSRVLSEELTDRQRIVLETAFAAGYFDSPRLRSGSEVADALDISGPTFHEHLRKALYTFLDRFLADQSGKESEVTRPVAQLREQPR